MNNADKIFEICDLDFIMMWRVTNKTMRKVTIGKRVQLKWKQYKAIFYFITDEYVL